MWAQIVNAILGIWLMAAPAVLAYGAPAQTNDRIVGPVAATFAIVACWEATRGVGRLNLLSGLWLLLAPWILGYEATAALANSMAVGALMGALSFVQGSIEHRYGGGWKALFQHEPPLQHRG